MWTAAPLDPELRDAYLARLGLDAEPPSYDALRRLHQRQVERVPYETMWIHAGEAWGIDPLDSVMRIATQYRGGYCYHLNGAFGLLLRALGYDVTGHAGGVHGPTGPDPSTLGNHLVLTVAGLPTGTNPDGTWYVDAGLGDALYEPLPLAAGAYVQPPFHLSLEAVDGDDADWHLTHDPAGGFTGMSWSAPAASRRAFAEKHEWLSTAPESGFVQLAMAEHRDATGVDVIRGLVLSRVGDSARTDEPLTRRDDWFGVLADLFDLRFEVTPPEALDALWARVCERQREWEASKQA